MTRRIEFAHANLRRRRESEINDTEEIPCHGDNGAEFSVSRSRRRRRRRAEAHEKATREISLGQQPHGHTGLMEQTQQRMNKEYVDALPFNFVSWSCNLVFWAARGKADSDYDSLPELLSDDDSMPELIGNTKV
jgi:hypothetical protein